MDSPAHRPGLVVPALLLALGVVIGAGAIGQGLRHLRTADRYVTVKGVAEREVVADVALWPLRFTAADDDLGAAQRKMVTARATVLTFLQGHDLDTTAVDVQGFAVTDVAANPYRSGPVETRFIIEQTLMVRSDRVDLIEGASQAVGQLVAAGVILGGQHGPSSGPTYLFTGLTDLKPEMVAEATANARRAAEQFAADSESTVGGIRHASQGVFQILPRDPAPGVMEASQPHKTVRVVSTIQYYLED